jgi:RNA polymerase sigma-70 factor (ECF subfamily)
VERDPDRPTTGEGGAREGELVALMIGYQAGRLEAFEALHGALAGDVRRFFAASIHEPAAVLDLVQQTFLELHRARQTYRPPRPVRPWVFGIAVNVRRRHRRDAATQARRTADAPDAIAGVVGPAPDLVGGMAVRRALARLPEGRRRAWILHHVHGFSFQEIGRQLGIGAGAAKLRSSRAMRGLRALLTGRDRIRDDDE